MNQDYRIIYKVAALEFLNNISLDGTYNDNKVSIPLPNIKLIQDHHEIEDVKQATHEKGGIICKNKITDQGSVVNRLLTKRMFETFCNRKRRTTSSSSISSISDEKGNLKTKFVKQRLVIVSPNQKVPFSIYSILPFTRRKKSMKTDLNIEKSEMSRSRLISGNSSTGVENASGFGLLQMSMEEDVSYQHLLKPIIYQDSKCNLLANKTSGSVSTGNTKLQRYDPNLLDDPEMINNRKKVVLQLPCYLSTVINYVRPIDMKTDINEQFRQKFPEIKLTLSKIRSLKGNILSVAKKQEINLIYNQSGIDLWTVANAFVYFETLVLKNLVTKTNRKLCCAAALILSAKINDIRGSELTTTIQELENTFRIHRREIFQYELCVFVALEFGLLSNDKTINVHYKRLMRTG